MVGLPADVVRALADAGFLRPVSMAGGSPRFALGDLKAFVARNHDEGPPDKRVWSAVVDAELPTAEELLASLDGRAAQIAERLLEQFGHVFPGAATYGPGQRARFLSEARERIEAVLAVCARGPGVGRDEIVEEDLAGIGGDAALAGVSLAGVLTTIRISRDLVVNTAIEVAEERGRHWGVALAVVLTRVLPAVDRLSDAVARGYWDAVLDIENESLERYRNLVELASDGVFEVDAEGIVRHANPALLHWLGRNVDTVIGAPIDRVFVAVEDDALQPGEPARTMLVEAAGSARFLRIRQLERIRDGVVVGWDGVVNATR